MRVAFVAETAERQNKNVAKRAGIIEFEEIERLKKEAGGNPAINKMAVRQGFEP